MKIKINNICVQVFFLINGLTEKPFYVESILMLYMIVTSFSKNRTLNKGENND